MVTEIVNLFCGRDGRDLISTINLMLEYLEILDREVLTTKVSFSIGKEKIMDKDKLKQILENDTKSLHIVRDLETGNGSINLRDVVIYNNSQLIHKTNLILFFS